MASLIRILSAILSCKFIHLNCLKSRNRSNTTSYFTAFNKFYWLMITMLIWNLLKFSQWNIREKRGGIFFSFQTHSPWINADVVPSKQSVLEQSVCKFFDHFTIIIHQSGWQENSRRWQQTAHLTASGCTLTFCTTRSMTKRICSSKRRSTDSDASIISAMSNGLSEPFTHTRKIYS